MSVLATAITDNSKSQKPTYEAPSYADNEINAGGQNQKEGRSLGVVAGNESKL